VASWFGKPILLGTPDIAKALSRTMFFTPKFDHTPANFHKIARLQERLCKYIQLNLVLHKNGKSIITAGKEVAQYAGVGKHPQPFFVPLCIVYESAQKNMEKLMDESRIAVQRLRHGDMGGLEILVARHQVRAVRTAFLILQDEDAAQDVVQETFLRIYQRIHQFDDSLPFEPYLLKSVVHASLNLARRSAKFTSLDGNPAEVESLLDGADQPEAQVEARQLSQEILTALSKISPRQRAVIVQRYYLEMSEKEMSEHMQAAPGTIKWLLNAARTRLRDLLRMERSSQ
jgi:RNA polymerase sigma-70 factor (ECF subfamily)